MDFNYTNLSKSDLKAVTPFIEEHRRTAAGYYDLLLGLFNGSVDCAYICEDNNDVEILYTLLNMYNDPSYTLVYYQSYGNEVYYIKRDDLEIIIKQQYGQVL